MRIRQFGYLGFVVFVGSTLAACNKSEGAGSSEAKSEPALIQGPTTGPAGYQWEKAAQGSVGSLDVPTGGDWKKSSGSPLEIASAKLGITIMLQQQAAIQPEQRSEYMASLTEVNKRDAPKYAVTGTASGQIQAAPAARLDGKFDNGTAYSTRDYVLFVKNTALAVMVRGPVAQEADVRAIADHIATSLK